jgi:hypothetical protein
MTAREAGARLPVAEFAFESQESSGPWHVRQFQTRETLGGTYTVQVDVIYDDPDRAFFALDGSPLRARPTDRPATVDPS